MRADRIFPIASLARSRDSRASPSAQYPAAEVTQAADLRQHRSADICRTVWLGAERVRKPPSVGDLSIPRWDARSPQDRISRRPWILGAPQSGLARLMSRISALMSTGSFGRPPGDFDFHRQYQRPPPRGANGSRWWCNPPTGNMQPSGFSFRQGQVQKRTPSYRPLRPVGVLPPTPKCSDLVPKATVSNPSAARPRFRSSRTADARLGMRTL
jgi:hypothetical protein